MVRLMRFPELAVGLSALEIRRVERGRVVEICSGGVVVRLSKQTCWEGRWALDEDEGVGDEFRGYGRSWAVLLTAWRMRAGV